MLRAGDGRQARWRRAKFCLLSHTRPLSLTASMNATRDEKLRAAESKDFSSKPLTTTMMMTKDDAYEEEDSRPRSLLLCRPNAPPPPSNAPEPTSFLPSFLSLPSSSSPSRPPLAPPSCIFGSGIRRKIPPHLIYLGRRRQNSHLAEASEHLGKKTSFAKKGSYQDCSVRVFSCNSITPSLRTQRLRRRGNPRVSLFPPEDRLRRPYFKQL